jgi:hypothetical protein
VEEAASLVLLAEASSIVLLAEALSLLAESALPIAEYLLVEEAS